MVRHSSVGIASCLVLTATVGIALLSSGCNGNKPETEAPVTQSPSAPPADKMAAAPAAGDMVATGKTIAMQRCAKCHGPELLGKKPGPPPLTPNGPMRHYDVALFERLLSQGVDEDNKPVRPPMNRIKLEKADADAVFAYLKTLK